MYYLFVPPCEYLVHKYHEGKKNVKKQKKNNIKTLKKK